MSENLFLIEKTKEAFNRFFKEELYGAFGDKENLILSRGSWNDKSVRLPSFFEACVRLTLKNNWVGYSHSLGHIHALAILRKFVNNDIDLKGYEYGADQIALTMGNVLTCGIVFQQLFKKYSGAGVLAFKPFYPPILKSISRYFTNIHFVSSLEIEDKILLSIRESIEKNDIKILFLNNIIGVEGRTFSVKFWEAILILCKDLDLFLVIEEGLGFFPAVYPNFINTEKVVRVASLSKKYGIPGMKLGFLLADPLFMSDFYESASSNYGGPPSFFFLLSEFLYSFEFTSIQKNAKSNVLDDLAKRYGLSMNDIRILYEDYIKTAETNNNTFDTNYKIFIEWYNKNKSLFRKCYDFKGFNVLLEPRIEITCHDFFIDLVKNHKVSILPSICLGDYSDKLFRITLLEPTDVLLTALDRLKIVLEKYETKI